MRLSYSLLARALALGLLPLGTALAQTGVTIGASTAPDASAALDVVSSTKGALLPRVADATAIASPATGLIVYQTGGTAGYYYYTGSSWQQIATASGAAVTAGNGLTKTGATLGLGGTLTGATTLAQAGNAFGLTGGSVGIGTAAPAARLHVLSADNTASTDIVKVSSNNGASGVSLGYFGLRASGTNANDRLTLDAKGTGPLLLQTGGGTGGVGVGTTAPDASAALDLVSSTKGALLPRVADATALASPATGLIVFQTGGTAGFYYNAGTATAASWQRLATTAETALTATNGLTRTGATIGLGGTLTQTTVLNLNNQAFGLINGRVGIGNPGADPAAALDVVSNNQGVLLPRLSDLNQVQASFGGVPEGLLLYRFSGSGTVPSGFYYNTIASATPNWQRLMPASEALAPANGLSRTGGTVGLGGALQQATTLDLNGNSLAVRGGSSQQISQLLANDLIGGNVSGYGASQSFTLPANAVPTRIDIYPQPQPGGPTSPVSTFALYQGNLGGTLLASKQVDYSNVPAGTPVSVDLTLPAQPAGTYVFSTGGTNFAFLSSTGNPYSGGGAYDNSGYLSNEDLKFVVYYTTNAAPTLSVSSGQVGVGTTTPSATLDVSGTVRLRGLGLLNGIVTTDANGNLGSRTLPPAPTGADFILNQTAATQTGGFRLSGNGVLGGALGLGTATPAALLHLYPVTSYSPSFQPNGTMGYVGGAEILFGNAGISKAASIQVSDDTQFGGGLYFNVHSSNGFDNWPTGTRTALTIRPSGDVGLSTTKPNTQLSISPDVIEAKVTLYDGGDVNNHYGFGMSSNQLNYHVLSASDRHVFYAGGKNGNGTELLRIQGNGRVGIGTNNPIAPLHVSGSASATPGGAKTFFSQGSAALASDASTTARNVVAYFTGGQFFVNDVIVAGALTVTSDRRIKRVIGLSDRAADLALLNKLRITDYTYIDQLSNSNQVIKKVIAQEVEQVLPAAVSRSTQALPNVYERATRVRFANGFVTVASAKPHELPATGGRMRFYTPANESLDPDVTVVDAHTVRFASAEAYAGGLFVYGKYVDDFRSVDYDALTTLNVSATQELARKVEALEQQNAALQVRAATAEAQATATADAFEARLRRLEAAGEGQAHK